MVVYKKGLKVMERKCYFCVIFRALDGVVKRRYKSANARRPNGRTPYLAKPSGEGSLEKVLAMRLPR